jgi:hypothetical protein
VQPKVGLGLLKQMSPVTSIMGSCQPISTAQLPCIFLHQSFFIASCHGQDVCPASFPLGFVSVFLRDGAVLPHTQPPTWRTRIITLDLSTTGGPTSSTHYRQHSFRNHITTQALPLHQSRDTFWSVTVWKTSFVTW